jgi:2-polyprenyl-3-methyl-5-hydroxy-6-metoxy-1,4-benzoquinol methylase
MNLNCPLTGSSEVTSIDKISAKTLVEMYAKIYNNDVSCEFTNVDEVTLYSCSKSGLKWFEPMVTGSESFYEKLQDFDWYYLEDKEEYEYASQFIERADAVLEIGCGKGAFSEKINCQKYLGLEYSQRAIELSSAKKIQILNESIQQHAKAHPETYDVVCSFQVLEHVNDIHGFIENSVKCLKTGGKLIYSVPSADSFIASAQNNILNMPPHHLSWWSDRALETIAEVFKLKIIAIHHEKLSEMHKSYYASSIILKALKNNIGMGEKQTLIDRSLSHKILSKVARSIGKWLEKGLNDDRTLPFGHSVTVVYEKKTNK